MKPDPEDNPSTRVRPPLLAKDLAPDPIEQLREWLFEAVQIGEPEPNAMALATVSAEGSPSARLVLLRGLDERGLVFYTHYRSRKGREIEANPRVALVFYWNATGRQARIEGVAERVTPAESDAYFDSRPFESRVGAIVSPQSETIELETDLHRAALDLILRSKRELEPVTRPEHWGGYRVRPTSFEFWQSGQNRLHDRFRYRKDEQGWIIERLAP